MPEKQDITTVREAVSAYLDNCRISGKSEDTLASYGRTLRSLADFLASHGAENAEDVSSAHLLAWKADCATRLSITSLDLYLRHARLFFDFCVDTDILSKSPYKASVMAVNRAALRSVAQKPYQKNLTEQDFRSILSNNAPRNMHRATYARNRAMLALFLTSGMRNTSLRLLTPRDLDWENGVVHVRVAKGGKSADVLFSDIAKQAMRAWLQDRPSLCTDSDPIFGFLSASGAWMPYSRQQVSEIVNASVRGFAGVEGERSHAMRHSMATLLQHRGMSQGEIAILLMHSEDAAPRVTRRYIEADYSAVFRKANAIFNRIAA